MSDRSDIPGQDPDAIREEERVRVERMYELPMKQLMHAVDELSKRGPALGLLPGMTIDDCVKRLLALAERANGAPTAKWYEGDWTTGPDGRANTSPAFVDAVEHVEMLIRDSANELIAGRAGSVARLIVAQLAHVKGLVPVEVKGAEPVLWKVIPENSR